MTLNLEELREAEALMARMAEHAEKILPALKCSVDVLLRSSK